jgi:hypothetical protein
MGTRKHTKAEYLSWTVFRLVAEADMLGWSIHKGTGNTLYALPKEPEPLPDPLLEAMQEKRFEIFAMRALTSGERPLRSLVSGGDGDAT